MKFYYPALCLSLAACANQAPIPSEQPAPKEISLPARPEPYTFFDSIQHGLELTPEQVRWHLPGLDSTNTITGSRIFFPVGRRFALATFWGNDQQGCANHYVVTIDKASMVTIDWKMLSMECDGDYGHYISEYTRNFLNDTTIQVLEMSHLDLDSDSIVPIDSTYTTWRIIASGKIVEQKEVKK